MTVEELVRAAAAGDQDAFAQLVALYEKRVYALALRTTGNQEDAADVAQEAFLAAWRGLPSFRGEAGFATWLYDEALGLNAVDAAPTPQERAEGEALREAVRWGMGELSRDHRQVLELREYQELSYEEIAGQLGVDLGTVKSRLSRARGALRKILLKSGNLSGYLPSNLSENAAEKGGRK